MVKLCIKNILSDVPFAPCTIILPAFNPSDIFNLFSGYTNIYCTFGVWTKNQRFHLLLSYYSNQLNIFVLAVTFSTVITSLHVLFILQGICLPKLRTFIFRPPELYQSFMTFPNISYLEPSVVVRKRLGLIHKNPRLLMFIVFSIWFRAKAIIFIIDI